MNSKRRGAERLNELDPAKPEARTPQNLQITGLIISLVYSIQCEVVSHHLSSVSLRSGDRPDTGRSRCRWWDRSLTVGDKQLPLL